MYLQIDNIHLDFEKSAKFGQVFVQGGSYESMGTLHNFPNFLERTECDLKNFYANLKKACVEFTTSDDSFHLGGYMCVNDKIQYINPSSECITYTRAFDSSFDISTNKIESTVDTCIPGGAYNTDYNVDFDI